MVSFKKSPPINAYEPRLAELERRVAALESSAQPQPKLTDEQLLERAWRAGSLTADERDELVRAKTRNLGCIPWDARLRIEAIAARASEQQSPAAELIELASLVAQLSERERDIIKDARSWVSERGFLPDELRAELERSIALRGVA